MFVLTSERSRHQRRDLRPAAPVPAGPARGRRAAGGHLDQGGPALARVLPAQPSARARRPQDADQPSLGRAGRVHPPGQHPAAPLHHDRGGGPGPAMGARPGRGRPGSFIELSEPGPGGDRRRPSTPAGTGGGWPRAGQRASPRRAAPRGRGRRSGTLVNSRVVPWADLPAAERSGPIDYLRSQLAQLEDVGFMPVVPPGGPPEAAEFRRIGTVRARRLHARRPWTRRSGDELHGDAGDWRVVDDGGDERTVRDPEFRDSHEPLGGEFWLRTGTYRAWQVSQAAGAADHGGPGGRPARGLGGGRGPGRTLAGHRRPVPAQLRHPPGSRQPEHTPPKHPVPQTPRPQTPRPPAHTHGAQRRAANSPGLPGPAPAHPAAVPPPRRQPPDQTAIRNP